MKAKAITRDGAFASRLEQACATNPKAPPAYGRLTWIAKGLSEQENVSISVESVRKWMTGEARPRPDRMAALARFLEVDEAWLALGKNPTMTVGEKKVRARNADGAVNLMIGLSQLAGGHVAVPVATDPNAGKVDFYVILGGRQRAMQVALAKVAGRDLSFSVRTDYEAATVVGVVPTGGMKFDVVYLPPNLIARNGKTQGGFVEVGMTATDLGSYVSDDDFWPVVHDLGADLGQ